jgi:hypothetical protein
MIRRIVVVLALLIAFIAIGYGQDLKSPIVRQADHVLIEAANPKDFFRLFTDTLLLPTAFPLAEKDGIVSGGFSAGNIIFQMSGRARGNAPRTSRFSGIAFEPLSFDKTLQYMNQREMVHGKPQPYISTLPDGTKGVWWTTLELSTLSKEGMSIYLYEYSPAFLNVTIRKRQLANRLTLNNGGPLGIVSAKEIIISTKNPAKQRQEWNKLLGTQDGTDLWKTGEGPAIQLTQGPKDEIIEIVLKIKSLEQAKNYLRSKKLEGLSQANTASINHPLLKGLKITLSQ